MSPSDGPRPRDRSPRVAPWILGCLWAMAALLLLRVAVVTVQAGGRSSNGFVAYYTASRMLLEGADPARFYDESWFSGQVALYEPDVHDVFSANPPTMSLLVLPLAWLPYRTARRAWIGGSALLLLATVAFLVGALGLKGPWAPGFVAFALAAEPVRECLALGQAYVLVLALLVAAWWGWRSRRPVATGLPLGVIAATKAAALPLWLLLAVGRRRVALAAGALGVLVLAGASVPVVGPGPWLRWLEAGRDLAGDPRFGVTAFQSLPGFFRHLATSGSSGLWRPWLPIPWVGHGLALATVVALLAWTLRVAARRPTDGRVYAAFVLAGLLASPVTHEHHFVVALLPVAILAGDASVRGDRAWALALVAATLAVLAPLPYRAPLLADGALAFLAYPRLYGCMALWAMAVAREPVRPTGGTHAVPCGSPEGQPVGFSTRRRTT